MYICMALSHACTYSLRISPCLQGRRELEGLQSSVACNHIIEVSKSNLITIAGGEELLLSLPLSPQGVGWGGILRWRRSLSTPYLLSSSSSYFALFCYLPPFPTLLFVIYPLCLSSFPPSVFPSSFSFSLLLLLSSLSISLPFYLPLFLSSLSLLPHLLASSPLLPLSPPSQASGPPIAPWLKTQWTEQLRWED